MLKKTHVFRSAVIVLSDGTIKTPVVTAGSLFPLQGAASVFVTTLGLSLVLTNSCP